MKARHTGRAAFLALLADEGIDHLFGNPGTTELAIMEALASRAEIRFVLGLQESVVLGMADGFARASNRLTAANVHVAPGLGNAMGALYNAAFCGSPIILTAGQQELGHGLMEPLLYGPLVQMAQPLVKWAIEVTRVQDLPRIVRRAAKVATAPPSGPVFISLPGDILDAEADLEMGSRTRVEPMLRPADAVIEDLARRLLQARYPVIVAGTEISKYQAWAECTALAEVIGASVHQQTVPDAAHFPTAHPAYMGTLPRNQKKVREILLAHDLLVSVGGDSLRMSVHSAVEALPEGMAVVQLSERSWDLGKNFPAEFALECNVKETLAALLPRLGALADASQAAAARTRIAELSALNWSAQRARATAEFGRAAAQEPIDPRYLMLRVAEALPANAVVIEEALTATPALMSVVPYPDARSFMGLAGGGIGFAMPGAVGASLALPGRPVVAVVGDGSAMYSIQALWTAVHLKLPITYVILNNRSYRILKERMVAFRGARAFAGMDFHDPQIDFTNLAQSMGVTAVRVSRPGDVDAALREAIASGAPRLLEVMVADGFDGSGSSKSAGKGSSAST
ncbi:MAG: thiamine pyrophosphate-binding protein [Betaproteobacteria bacterium]|nr:MAG: thiamine pyrophosphate-binding protein [Betaproteobacteria bacterium]